MCKESNTSVLAFERKKIIIIRALLPGPLTRRQMAGVQICLLHLVLVKLYELGRTRLICRNAGKAGFICRGFKF